MMISRAGELFFSLRREIRFLLIGGATALVGLGAVFAMQMLFAESLQPQAIFLAGNVLVSPLAYLAMKFCVFETSGNYCREYVKYLTASALNLLVGVGILSLALGVGAPPYLGHVAGMVLGAAFLYTFHLFVTFARRTDR